MTAVPEGYEDLLIAPLYGDLATVRPDGDPSVSPMWFVWDGDVLKFTHTTGRQKLKDIAHNSHVAFIVTDPTNPQRYLQVRGDVVDIVPDKNDAEFYQSLMERYGRPKRIAEDAAERVIVSVRPFAFTKRG
jgi:PPOX class probable F420-dependent enzyme